MSQFKTPIPMGSARKKRRSPGSVLREAWLMHKFRASRYDAGFDYDWHAMRYNRLAVVNLLMSGRPGGDYLEIGCAGNQLFDAVIARHKTGIDPVRGGTHRMTSDAWFAANPQARFDVIFIDGLHTYDQVRRDLVHALGATRQGGWIALHDMLTRDWVDEHVPQISTAGWTGDGWKCAFELAATAGLDFRLIAIDHGVLVIKVGQPGIELSDMRVDLASRRFDYLHLNAGKLPIADWDEARTWIESQFQPEFTNR